MKKGFTLIELMVVIVIMGILAAVAVPKIFGNVDKAKLSGGGETLAQFEQAVANYWVLNSEFPDAVEKIDFSYPENEPPFVYEEATDVTVAKAGPVSIDFEIQGIAACEGLTLSTSVAKNAAGEIVATRGGDALTTAACATKLTKVEAGTIVLID